MNLEANNNEYTNCDLKNDDLNKMIEILQSPPNNDKTIFLFDLANRAPWGSSRKDYIMDNFRSDSFCIFSMNNNCAKELKLPRVSQPNILVIYGDNNELLRHLRLPHKMHNNKLIFVITENSIECDDKVIIYISYKINNPQRVKIITADDYTRPQHDREAVDLGTINTYFGHNIPINENKIKRIPNVASIYRNSSDYPNRKRIYFDAKINNETDQLIDFQDLEKMPEDQIMDENYWKNKYLKYKLKYIELKKTLHVRGY